LEKIGCRFLSYLFSNEVKKKGDGVTPYPSPSRNNSMNKNQEHSQQVVIKVIEILTEPFFYTEQHWRNLKTHNRTRTISCFGELADELTKRGVMNYYGQPYTHWTLRKMIQRMDKVDEDSDFRQQHYPMFLHLKDNNIGLRTPTRPAKPIKSRTAKTADEDEELDTRELQRLHEEHQYALPPELRNKINFHSSVQSVQ